MTWFVANVGKTQAFTQNFTLSSRFPPLEGSLSASGPVCCPHHDLRQFRSLSTRQFQSSTRPQNANPKREGRPLRGRPRTAFESQEMEHRNASLRGGGGLATYCVSWYAPSLVTQTLLVSANVSHVLTLESVPERVTMNRATNAHCRMAKESHEQLLDEFQGKLSQPTRIPPNSILSIWNLGQDTRLVR